jgi:serine phosphatase RsbU (regulator of sigma subunit)/anti-sigma regulatory factor (Ser/Thr protein kinase)
MAAIGSGLDVIEQFRRLVNSAGDDEQHAVDRAVGLLAGHLRCSLAEAQAQVMQVAAEEGRTSGEVAAAAIRLLDVPARDQSAEDTGDLVELLRMSNVPQPSGVPAARGWLDAHQADDLARVLADRLGDTTGATAVVIAAATADGAAEVVGAAGVPADSVGRWQAVPASAGTDVSTAIRGGTALWHSDADGVRPPYRVLDHLTGRWSARAWLPVRIDGQVAGVVGVLWRTAVRLDADVRSMVRQAVSAHERRLRGVLAAPAGAPVPARWAAAMQTVLDVLPMPAALVTPVRDQRGRVVDFRCEAVSPAAADPLGRRGAALRGVCVLHTYPGLRDTAVWPAMRETLMTGRPRTAELPVYRPPAHDDCGRLDGTVNVRRFGDGLLVTWSFGTGDPLTAERMAGVERLGNLGWCEWDLATGDARWSPQLYRIFERDPSLGPATFDELNAMIVAEDVSARALATADLIEHGRPLDLTYRVRIGGRIKVLRAVGEAVRDATGRPAQVYGLLQDVTTTETVRERLDEGRRRLQDEQRARAAEQRLEHTVQRSLLPRWPGVRELPGLRVDARYWPADPRTSGGGDWYDAAALPGGDGALFMVGDVTGRGVLATTAMSHLRRCLHALAKHESDPARLVTALNRLLLDTDEELTASVAVARFDAASGRLTWAQAGSPGLLLVHRGRPRMLARPAGMVLGIDREAHYATATLDLDADDLLMLYTDGLVHRQGRTVQRETALLSRVVRVAVQAADPVTALLDTLPVDDLDDDACVLVAQHVAPPRPQCQGRARGAPLIFEADGLAAVRHRAAALAREAGLDEIAGYKFVLAVTEVATNAVRHAGGAGTAWFWRDGDTLVAEISDAGPGIPPRWRSPGNRPRPGRIGASGLWLVREICTSVEMDTGPSGTRVALRYAVPD